MHVVLAIRVSRQVDALTNTRTYDTAHGREIPDGKFGRARRVHLMILAIDSMEGESGQFLLSSHLALKLKQTPVIDDWHFAHLIACQNSACEALRTIKIQSSDLACRRSR